MNSSGSRPRRPPRNARARTVQGNDLLYHYFQKTLLEEDPEQFRRVTVGLVRALAVWLPLTAYQRVPLLVPYAVRDPSCRGDPRRGVPDEWGAPDQHGRFRDDNSLIKGIPRSLPIESRMNPVVNGRRVGTGFVAAHIWRKLADGSDAARDAQTYSFVPNLVWLPTQLAKLSDRENGFVQTLLQAFSIRLYRRVRLSPRLTNIVEPIWRRLPVRDEAAELAIQLDVDRVNFFRFDATWLGRRRRILEVVRGALVSAGSVTDGKVVASRYGSGLGALRPAAVATLLEWLTQYADALGEMPADGAGAR